MSESSEQGLSNPKPWVIVWTAQADRYEAVPSLFDRGAEGQCPFERALGLAQTWATPDLIVPVVLRPQKPWWARQVGTMPVENLAEQPFNRGSAPGILLAALRVYRKERGARVILLSADSDLVSTSDVEESLEQVGDRDDVVVLAQAQLSHGATVASRPPVTAYRRVNGDWRMALRAGQARGGGIIVASAAALLQLFVDTQPELTDQFLTTLTGPSLFDEDALDRLYPFLPETDFQAGVLAAALKTRASSPPAPSVQLTPSTKPERGGDERNQNARVSV